MVRDERLAEDGAPVPSAAPVPTEAVRRYLGQSAPSSTWRMGTVETLRRETRREALAVRGELAPVAGVEALHADGVPGRLYHPLDPVGPGDLMIWVHGGGWIHGDLDSYEGVARALAAATRRPVLAVDYRLAPEHPYPAPLDDVWSAFTWASSRYERVVLAGDSSGGNLAAAAAIKARDLGRRLALQVLIYPVLDSDPATSYKLAFRDRYADFAGQPGFGASTYDRIEDIWARYVPDPARRREPYASPSHADSLRGVAPAVVVTAEHDFLRGEDEDYARRLRRDGVAVTSFPFPGQIHGFFQMRGEFEDARLAMTLVAGAIGNSLDAAQAPAAGPTCTDAPIP